jgi:hypothetical protein
MFYILRDILPTMIVFSIIFSISWWFGFNAWIGFLMASLMGGLVSLITLLDD